MKRAKQFVILRTSAGRRSEGVPRPRTRKESSVPERIPRKQLEPTAAGAISPIDSVLADQLRSAMAGLSAALTNACLERKLLPLSLCNRIDTARFLSYTVLAARAAQVVTGVPASILIAEAWHLASGVGVLRDGLTKFDDCENDWFGTGESFSSIGGAFLDHANRLTRAREFQPVMLAKDDAAEYLKELGRCTLWDELGRKDRVAMITNDGLRECDALPDDMA